MSTVPSLDEYRQQVKKTDQVTWLGVLTYFTVTETSVSHMRLANELTSSGLGAYVPRPPADSDTFRRVAPNGQRRGGIATTTAGVTERLMVRPVTQDGGRIVKRIVVETVDSNAELLGYHESVDIVFDDTAAASWTAKSGAPKPQPTVRWTNLNGFHPESIALAEKITADYYAQLGQVNADAVRRVVGRVLDGCHATMIREGLYFCAAQHTATIEALEDAINRIEGARVHSIPLVDNEKQRIQVKEAFELEVTGDSERLIDEIRLITRANAADGTKISQAKADSIVRQHRKLQAKLNEYQELLAGNVDMAEFCADLLRKRIPALLDCVK